MPDDDRNDAAPQWENEYEAWCAEQDAAAADALNRVLRAIGDGTVYDPREDYGRE